MRSLDKIAIGLERVETYKSFDPKGLHRLDKETDRARRPLSVQEILPGCGTTD